MSRWPAHLESGSTSFAQWAQILGKRKSHFTMGDRRCSMPTCAAAKADIWTVLASSVLAAGIRHSSTPAAIGH